MTLIEEENSEQMLKDLLIYLKKTNSLSSLQDIHDRINGLRDSFYDSYKDYETSKVNFIKENQLLAARIKILEEQQEVQHNFLVEINKYLEKVVDKMKEI